MASAASEHVLEKLDTPVKGDSDGTVSQGQKDTVHVEQALTLMKSGSLLTKVRSIGRRYRRNFYIDENGLTLRYRDSKKNHCWHVFYGSGVDQSKISIKQIREVRDGANPDTSKKGNGQRSRNMYMSVPCFTVVVGDDSRTLDLIAPNMQIKDMWVNGLRHLVESRKVVDPAVEEEMWIKERFLEADKNGNGKLDKDEVIQLMMSMNVCPPQSHYVKHHIKVDDVNVSRFVALYKELSKRSEVDELFHKYSHNGDYMTADELLQFFKKEQNQTLDIDKVIELITASETYPALKVKKVLSEAGFNILFASEMMNIRQPICRTVYHDMTRPLNEYFINSSHNTYLEGHQLYGSSRVEQYIRVLNHRCRCVELDVWDGDDDEPIIYHGYTLTSKILLKDALEAIGKYAFKKSKFPIILSIENHCSLEQQKQMAHHFRNIFGKALLVEPLGEGSNCLPSPDQLVGRVIVKGKKLPADLVDGEDYCTTEEDEAAQIEDEEVQRKVHKRGTKHSSSIMSSEQRRDSKPRHSVKPSEHKTKLALELSDCVVICQAATFKSFEDSVARLTFAHISSFSEDKALKLATQDGGIGFLRHNAWQLSRIYPAGRRTASQNYNPLPMWLAGCQIVALNFQTRDDPLLLNYGFFEDNGACGYVLKPEFMRSSDGQKLTFNMNGPHPPEWCRTLTVRVISGYMLPKKIGDDKSSILDPFVEVEIYGVEADCSKQKTRRLFDNGFHPVWNETLSYTVSCPQLALVLFRVIDYETTSSDVLVAQYCLPMRCMQTGYRMIALRDMNGEVVGPASLFVHITISQPTRQSFW